MFQPYGTAIKLLGWITLLGAAHMATAQTQVDITIRTELGSATQVVMPQTRVFPINPNNRGVDLTSVSAHVEILDQTATTTLEVNLANHSSSVQEAVLLLPVPEDAVVSSFMFQGASSEPTAKILRRDEAARIYAAIVAKVRDPALLEFAGYNLIRSSVFPIEAGGTQRVRITWENILESDGERIDYLLPRTESLALQVPWQATVDIQSRHPISMVYSPTHTFKTERVKANHMRCTLVDSSSLDPGPIRLSYLRESRDVSASLFAYPDPKIGGGYFLLLAGLPVDADDQRARQKRDVTIVLDRSGSMAGEKMDQALAAALQVVEGLKDGESVNIIDYSTTVSSMSANPVVLNEAMRRSARAYLNGIRPTGGTNIHDALLEALRTQPQDGSLPLTLFLTDGLPTVGQTSEVAIREMVEKGNPFKRRVFTFGVGGDVNVPLLDRISDATRAVGTYVLPGEDVELAVAKTFRKLDGPILAEIDLQTIGHDGTPAPHRVKELVPAHIPDLFEGDQLIVLGQYTDRSNALNELGMDQGQAAPIRFRLSGDYFGKKRTFEFEFDVSSATTRNAFVARLWASRRIAYLVDQIRQAGAASGTALPVANGSTSIFDDPRYSEIAHEILRLSTEFGILTEYTAFLATEGTDLNNWNSLMSACTDNLDNRAVKARWGVSAVNQGINFNLQKQQSKIAYQNAFIDANLNRVEFSNVQQMCDKAFFKRGQTWIDSSLVASGPGQDEDSIEPDIVLEFASPQHLAFLEELIKQDRQGLLALEGDVILNMNGQRVLIRNTSAGTDAPMP